MLETKTFEGGALGPKLVIFGGIHGDEVCGPAGIREVIADLDSGALPLLKGSVTFVPVCNPKAYAANTRLVEENLNRVFRKTEHPQSYEATLANELCPLLDDADVFLDVHSMNAPGAINVFIDYPSPENDALAAALPGDYALFDWPAVYEGNEHGFESFTTNRYAHEAGATEVLIECGQHEDPAAVGVAREAILRTFEHLGMTEPRGDAKDGRKPMQKVRMKKIYAHEKEGDRFTKEWQHLEAVPAGTCVAERVSGERIVVTNDSIIIFPKVTAKPGEEWFYIGELER